MTCSRTHVHQEPENLHKGRAMGMQVHTPPPGGREGAHSAVTRDFPRHVLLSEQSRMFPCLKKGRPCAYIHFQFQEEILKYEQGTNQGGHLGRWEHPPKKTFGTTCTFCLFKIK